MINNVRGLDVAHLFIPIHKALHQVPSNLWDVIIVSPSIQGSHVIREQKNPHIFIKVLRQPLLRPTYIFVSLQPCASPHGLYFVTKLQTVEKDHIAIRNSLMVRRWPNLPHTWADLTKSSQTPIFEKLLLATRSYVHTQNVYCRVCCRGLHLVRDNSHIQEISKTDSSWHWYYCNQWNSNISM